MDEIQKMLEMQIKATLEIVSSNENEVVRKKALQELSILSNQLTAITKANEEKNFAKKKELLDKKLKEIEDINLKHDEYVLKKEEADREYDLKQSELELKKTEIRRKYDISEMEMDLKDRELDIREEELKSEKKNRIISWILGATTAGTGIASLVLTNRWLKNTMTFEETGTFTSRSSKFVSDIRRLFGGKG